MECLQEYKHKVVKRTLHKKRTPFKGRINSKPPGTQEFINYKPIELYPPEELDVGSIIEFAGREFEGPTPRAQTERIGSKIYTKKVGSEVNILNSGWKLQHSFGPLSLLRSDYNCLSEHLRHSSTDPLLETIPPFLSLETEDVSLDSQAIWDMTAIFRDSLKFEDDLSYLYSRRLLDIYAIPTIPKLSFKGVNTGKMKILILDLDNTLIFSYPSQKNISDNFDLFFYTDTQIPFIVRPFLIDFLLRMKKLYKIIVFTAAEKQYAAEILTTLNKLAKETIFTDYYTKEHLYDYEGELVFKRIISGISENEIIIVDDSVSYWLHLVNNLIPIPSFRGDSQDKSLVVLYHYLEILSTVDDIRVINEDYLLVKERILCYDASQE